MRLFLYVMNWLTGGMALGMGMYVVIMGLSGVGVATSTLLWFGGSAMVAGHWIIISTAVGNWSSSDRGD